jgi:hypothetical protein
MTDAGAHIIAHRYRRQVYAAKNYREIAMKKRMVYGIMPVFPVLFVLCVLPSCGSMGFSIPAKSGQWENVTYHGENAPLLGDTAWMDVYSGDGYLFSQRGEILLSSSGKLDGFGNYGTWERTGTTVKIVTSKGYVYWEGTYDPEANTITGQYQNSSWKGHLAKEGRNIDNFTWKPFDETESQVIKLRRVAEAEAAAARNAAQTRQIQQAQMALARGQSALSQGNTAEAERYLQQAQQGLGIQAQQGTAQTTFNLAGTNWKTTNLSLGVSETIYFGNGTWVATGSSGSATGTYTYNGSTVTLNASNGTILTGTVSDTTLRIGNDQYTKQ